MSAVKFFLKQNKVNSLNGLWNSWAAELVLDSPRFVIKGVQYGCIWEPGEVCELLYLIKGIYNRNPEEVFLNESLYKGCYSWDYPMLTDDFSDNILDHIKKHHSLEREEYSEEYLDEELDIIYDTLWEKNEVLGRLYWVMAKTSFKLRKKVQNFFLRRFLYYLFFYYYFIIFKTFKQVYLRDYFILMLLFFFNRKLFYVWRFEVIAPELDQIV